MAAAGMQSGERKTEHGGGRPKQNLQLSRDIELLIIIITSHVGEKRHQHSRNHGGKNILYT